MSPVRKSIKLSSIHLPCLNVFSKKKQKETCIEFELFLASETLKAGGKKIVLSSLRDCNTVGRGLVHSFLQFFYYCELSSLLLMAYNLFLQ